MRTLGFETTLAAAGIKVAARRETKILRKLIGKGDVPGAEGMLKGMKQRGYTPREYIQTLGSGAEGVADLIATPQGLSVQKTYNPFSKLVSPEMLNRKKQFFQEAGKQLPGVLPEFRGQRLIPGKVRAPAHQFEYVPGRTLGEELNSARQAGDFDRVISLREQGISSKGKLEQAGQNIGLLPRDVYGHGGNVIVTPQGQMRPIDVLPLKPEETGPTQFGQKGIPLTPVASQKIFTGYGPPPQSPHARGIRRPEELKAMIHRGEEAGVEMAGRRLSTGARRSIFGRQRGTLGPQPRVSAPPRLTGGR